LRPAICTLLFFTLSAAAPAVGSEPQLGLEELMRRMAGTPGVVARFVETKQLALLELPLESRGTLYFVPPQRLARRTSSPGVSTLIIDGGRLTFRDQAGGEEIDLAASPVVRVLVENFIVLFNGDLVELRKRYRTSFEADDSSWVLLLTPRGAPLNRFVESVTMRGDVSGGMREMVMVEKGGDRTTTRFDQVDIDHVFDQRELAEVFSLETRKSP
jgi:hypothetical protein